MFADLTLEKIFLLVLIAAAVALIVFLIICVAKLTGTLKRVDGVIDDVKVITEVVSEKTDKVNTVVDGITKTVGAVFGGAKESRGVLSALAGIVNLVNSLSAAGREAQAEAAEENEKKSAKALKAAKKK